MKHHSYTPKGTCSRLIEFDLDDNGKIHNVKFTGGCPGNTIGVCTLAEGSDATELAGRLRGIPCRDKGTSCPDQLSCAISEALAD